MPPIRKLERDVSSPSLPAELPRPQLRLEEDVGISRGESGFSSLSRAIGMFGAGFNEGLANIIGLPVDILSAGLAQLGLPIPEPIGGAKNIKRGITKARLLPKAQTPTQKFIRRIGEEVGMTVPAIGTGLGLARVGAGLTGRAAPLIQPFAKTPGLATSIELASGVGGGIGAGIAQESFSESPGAETIGQVAGGIVPTLPFILGQTLKSSARGAVKSFSKKAIEKKTGDILATGISGQPEEVAEQIARGSRFIEREIGVKPTTAQVAGERRIGEVQGAVAKEIPEFGGRVEDILLTQRRQLRKTAGELIPEGDVERTANFISDQVEREKIRLREELDRTRQEVREIIDNLQGTSAPEELNELVRSRLVDAEKVAEEAASKLFNDIPGDVEIPILELKKRAINIEKLRGKAERPENIPEVTSVIKRFGQKEETEEAFSLFAPLEIKPKAKKPPSNTEPVSEILALRSRITDDIRLEMSKPDRNRRRIARLEELKDAVDDTISGPIEAPTEVAPLYEEARRFFREEVANKFRRGAAAKILRGGPLGLASPIPESATIRQFFRTGIGAKESAEEFQRIFANDAIAQQAIREAAVQDFANFAMTVDGKLDIKKARRWLGTHQDAFKVFPQIGDDLEKVTRAGLSADVLGVNVEQSIQRLEKSAARFFLNSDPQNAVNRALRSPTARQDMAELVNRTRPDRNALNGLRSAVWKEILQRSETATFDEPIAAAFLSPSKLRNTFERAKPILQTSGLYSPIELQRIERIIRAAEIIGTTSGLSAPTAQISVANRSIERTFGLTVPGILSRFYAVARGVVSPRFIISEMAFRGRRNLMNFLTKGQVNSLLEQALVNPAIAEDLLRRVGTTETNKMLKGHISKLAPVFLGTQTGARLPALIPPLLEERQSSTPPVLR